MKLKSLHDDRRLLVKALESKLGIKSNYLGAPTFAYEIGPYTVLKDGNLEINASDFDSELIWELTAEGHLEETEEGTGSIDISIPMDGQSGRSLMNIVFRINSRDELLSKMCGRRGAFCIEEKFIKVLDRRRPETIEDFFKILEECGGNKVNTGIVFTKDRITLSGFPYTRNTEMINAYMHLAEKMSKEANDKHRIRPDRIGLPDNEKYNFRNWLVAIGLTGDKYKSTRSLLLRNLKGHSAFRTTDQAEVQTKKWAEIRKERREEECPTFHVIG